MVTTYLQKRKHQVIGAASIVKMKRTLKEYLHVHRRAAIFCSYFIDIGNDDVISLSALYIHILIRLLKIIISNSLISVLFINIAVVLLDFEVASEKDPSLQYEGSQKFEHLMSITGRKDNAIHT